MCCEYKLACCNQCWQLLNSCPASMVNFIWFNDDKQVKFYHCSHKNAQNDHFYTLMGIAWLLCLPARQCSSTHWLRDGSVFGSQDAWFYAPMLLGADTMNIFHQWTRKSAPSKQGSNWEHQLRQASLYSQHITTSTFHHKQQSIFNYQPYFDKIFWIITSSATAGENFIQIDRHSTKF